MWAAAAWFLTTSISCSRSGIVPSLVLQYHHRDCAWFRSNTRKLFGGTSRCFCAAPLPVTIQPSASGGCMQQNDWIYDWNLASPPLIPDGTRVLLNDETLRDGLQNPSVHDPSIDEKIRILHLMESLGIDSVNIGLPGAGPRAAEHTEALAREIATNRMKIRPNCAAR